MKQLITAFLVMAAVTCLAKDLKILMVGNSFSRSVLGELPNIVKASSGDHLVLVEATVGGCTMERHVRLYENGLLKPEDPKYQTNLPIGGHKNKRGTLLANLDQLLEADEWDIVTIQQGSPHSFRPETYGKNADKLIAIVRKHAPKSEIVVQQTWSYNADHGSIRGEKPAWGVNQTTMYEKLNECYLDLAKKNHFRMIPTGNAVQLYRKYAGVPATSIDLSKYRTPEEVPMPVPDVVGDRLRVKKDAKTGQLVIEGDLIHLNKAGQYLQACVWYMYLFDRTAADVKYVPRAMKAETAELLKKCAEEAVKDATAKSHE